MVTRIPRPKIVKRYWTNEEIEEDYPAYIESLNLPPIKKEDFERSACCGPIPLRFPPGVIFPD